MKLTRGVRLATTVLVSQCNKILWGARQAGTRKTTWGGKFNKTVRAISLFVCFLFLFILIS